jgi:protein-S-isoprenylcysteine O-methyltransferase Ste14
VPEISPTDCGARCLVASAGGIIYWVGVYLQGRRIRKRIKRSPNLKPKGLQERLLWLGWMIVILGWIFQPILISQGFSAPGFQIKPACTPPWTFFTGTALTILGYAATLWCYAAMGNAWRIGVDRNEKTELITSGPYHWIRHPIYSFQSLMLLGVIFLLPSLASLFFFLLHLVCVRLKSNDEESYLLITHGQLYKDYQGKTGRLIPTAASLFAPAKRNDP